MTLAEKAGLSKRVDTAEGLAGEMHRLLLRNPTCPQRASRLVKFVYANAAEILQMMRLAED